MDTKTIYNKLSAVPKSIKQQFGSDDVVDIVDGMEKKFNLPNGSSGVVSKLLQRLEIKDIEPQYFAGELSLELKLDKNKALLITAYIDKTILSPIKKDLGVNGIDISLLGRFEIPAIKITDSSGPPTIIQDIGPMPTTSARPAPMPMKIPSVGRVTAAPPIPGSASRPATPAPMPTPAPAQRPAQSPMPKLSQAGWSKLTSDAPVVELSQTSAPLPAPAPLKPATPNAPRFAPEPITKTGIGEFERLRIQVEQKAGKAPGAGMSGTGMPVPTPPKPAGPAPVIIHEDASYKTQPPKAPNFFIPTPKEQVDFKKAGGPAGGSLGVKPAVLELGSAGAVPRIPVPRPSSTPRVVHYTEEKPISPAPTVSAAPGVPAANGGPRKITEVTAPPPVPRPTPPIPPASTPPKPPKP